MSFYILGHGLAFGHEHSDGESNGNAVVGMGSGGYALQLDHNSVGYLHIVFQCVFIFIFLFPTSS